MAKRKIPKAQQIKMIRGALKSKRTPKQFLPSLKKRLAKLTGAAVVFFALFAARPAIAQTPVTVQPTQQVLALAGTACTGSAQTFPVNNKNQTQHYAYVKTNSSVTNLTMQIRGVDSSGNVYVISDTAAAAIPVDGANAALLGSGYFPTVQIVVQCLPASTGTFTLFYSGSSATSNQVVGSYLVAQQDKTLASSAPANTTYTAVLQTPFGSSLGVIYFGYIGTGPAGSQLQIACQTQNGTGPSQFIYFPATTTNLPQSFAVPPGPCPNMTVQYSTGGASTAVYQMDYVFTPPGTSVTGGYTHITSTTATVVKAGPGVLHSVVVGLSAAGTISLFDLAPASCTGTPATNIVSVITEFASAAPPPPPEIYDTLFVNGICVKASATMDITVSSQ